LNEDPPPDLVIEIDITSPSLDRLQIYSAVGVPEVWRYRNAGIVILKLEAQAYAEQPESALLPTLTVEALNEFVRSGQTLKRRDWIRRVREWVRARQ
jgi:Uma2 family endonuclease